MSAAASAVEQRGTGGVQTGAGGGGGSGRRRAGQQTDQYYGQVRNYIVMVDEKHVNSLYV